MLIYNTLGKKAQDEFTTSWGVSYGMGQATEWQDIFDEAVKALVILAILERLQLTRHSDWLESHVDFLSLQASLFGVTLLSYSKQIRSLVYAQRRLCDDE